MRIWHEDLIRLLPRTQLLSQWRELNSIYKLENKHILINYVYNYKKGNLFNYSVLVIAEMEKRGYKISKWDNFINYFQLNLKEPLNLKNIKESILLEYPKWEFAHTFKEHDSKYYKICLFNLYEKFIRGQNNISDLLIREFNKL